MKPSRRSSLLVVVLVFMLTLTAACYAQAGDDAIARAAIANGGPDLGDRHPIPAASVQNGSTNQILFDADTGAVVSGGFNVSLNANASSTTAQTLNDDRFNVECRRHNRSNIDGLITLATFDGAFVAQAGPSAGGDFRFTMVGNNPRLGCTTVIPTNIAEIDLKLLNADGSVFRVVPFGPFEKLTMESPNFEPLTYRTGRHIEYADAVHRAQFFNVMGEDWHTLLIPRVVNKVTITVPRFVNVRLSNGTIIQARSYFTGTAADGNTFVLMLNLLFNFFFDNEVVNEINAGNFTTNGINVTMFPNTFLFSLNVNNPNTPGGCCVLGFHTYFLDGVFPESRWVTQYASWISPGLFGAGFQDVTALTHETAEIFGNPFVSNPTPNWQFPGVPANAKVCQNNLEEGDPIEVLANATTPITVKEPGFTFTYHPQNIPLLQWFEMGTTSSAIDGAFSFPDETVLPHSALPCPQ
jgi:hypothetical protein